MHKYKRNFRFYYALKFIDKDLDQFAYNGKETEI